MDSATIGLMISLINKKKDGADGSILAQSLATEVVDARVDAIKNITYSTLKARLDDASASAYNTTLMELATDQPNTILTNSVDGMVGLQSITGNTLRNLCCLSQKVKGTVATSYFYKENESANSVMGKIVTFINVTNKNIKYSIIKESSTRYVVVMPNEKKVELLTSMEYVGSVLGYVKDGWTDENKTSIQGFVLEGDYTDKEIPQYFENMYSVAERESNRIEITSQKKGGEVGYKTTIQLREPLRGLPNGVRDELDCVNNKLITRIRKTILNGSESWNLEQNFPEKLGFFTRLEDGSKKEEKSKINTINSRLADITVDSVRNTNDKIEGVAYDGKYTVLRVSILKASLSTPDVAGFKKWLQTNPTKVYYELAEPVVTDLKIPTLKNFKNGSIQLNNDIHPTVNLKYATNVGIRLSSLENKIDKNISEKELKMKNINLLTTETNGDLKNKLNEIINIWK